MNVPRNMSLVGLLMFCATCSLATAESESVNKQPTATWSGDVADPKLESVRPNTVAITTQADFEKVWKAWRGAEKVPIVDFKTSFVAIMTSLPNKKSKFVSGTKGISIFQMTVGEDGNATLLSGPALGTSAPKDPPEKWVETKGFYYGLAVFPRAGVKKLDGKELPAP